MADLPWLDVVASATIRDLTPRVTPEEKRLRRVLANNVRAIRLARGWTFEAAAGKAAIDERHWHRIEDGDLSVTLRTLAKLAAGLGVQAGELLLKP